MLNLARPFNSFAGWLYSSGRRWFTKNPSASTAEAHIAWLQEQVRAYATPQPYAAPLTMTADNITGETWEMREAYRKMTFKEPSVKSALLTKCLAVGQLDPQVQAADPSNKASREAAKWVKWSIGHADGGWPSLIWNILIPGLMDGFSVTEKVFGTIDVRSPQYAGFWTLRQAKSKDTRGIRYRLDTFKNVVAVQSMIAMQGGANFDPAEFILFTHLKVFENPFGISDLRAANRAVNLIESAIRLRAILLENFSGPFLIGKAPDSGTRQKMMSVLHLARARGWLVIPEGGELEVLNLATSAPDQFQTTIEDLRQEIVTAIQGAYLQLLEGGIADGRGNTQVHKSVAELFQWWLATCVASVINNSLVPDLVIPNYGHSVGMPVVSLGGVNSATVLQDLARFEAGHRLKLTLSKSQVQEVGGFESPDSPDDELPPPDTQQQGGPGGGGLGDLFGGGGGNDLSTVDKPDNSPDQAEPPGDTTVAFADDDSGGNPSGLGEHIVPFDRARFDAIGGESFRAFCRVSQAFADWKVGVSPKTGEPGYISSGGLFRKKDPRPADAEKNAKRATAHEAATTALTAPQKLHPDHVAKFREHLDTLPRDKVRELAKSMSLKAGGLKVHLAERLVARARGEAQPVFDYGKKAPSDTLTAVVKRFGGIDPNSHALKTHVSGMKEAIEYGINLGVFKKGGRGLDQMAKELHAAGHIASPDDEHLFEKLKAGALSMHADAKNQYDAAEESYWKAQAEAEAYATKSTANRARVEDAVRRGTDEGRSAAAGNPIPDAGPTPGDGASQAKGKPAVAGSKSSGAIERYGISVSDKTSKKTRVALEGALRTIEGAGIKPPRIVMVNDDDSLQTPAEARGVMIRVNPREHDELVKNDKSTQKKWGKPFAVDSSLEGVLLHEMTHTQVSQLPEGERNAVVAAADKMRTGAKEWLSMRAETDPHEFLSELGVAHLRGKKIPAEAQALAERVWGVTKADPGTDFDFGANVKPEPKQATADVPAGHKVTHDFGSGVVTTSDPKTGELTTRFPAGLAEASAAKHSAQILSAMSEAKIDPDYSDGLVPLGVIYSEFSRITPGVGEGEFLAAVSQMRKSRVVQGHPLNEVQKLKGGSVAPLGRGRDMGGATLWDNGRAIHYFTT